MRAQDDKGQPIPEVRVWSEMSIFFFAGVPWLFTSNEEHALSIF